MPAMPDDPISRVVAAKCAETAKAKELIGEIATYISEAFAEREFQAAGKTKFWNLLYAAAGARATDANKGTETEQREQRQKSERGKSQPQSSDDAEHSLEVNECIQELAEQINESDNAPQAALDYADSVSEKAADIAETIESKGRASEKQVQALENMLRGLERWAENCGGGGGGGARADTAPQYRYSEDEDNLPF